MKKILAAAILALTPMSAQAGPVGVFDDVWVFGDSISDPGNLASDPAFASQVEPPGVPIYPTGQFTNGDTWAVQKGVDRASGRNFAYGSARAATAGPIPFTDVPGQPIFDVPDFAAQIASFQLARATGLPLGANPVGIVAFGGNDLLAAFRSGDATAIPAAIETLVGGVDVLLASGLEKVVVFGVPDLGQIPEILAASDPFAALRATAASESFNSTLQAVLRGKDNVHYFDLFGLLQTAAANPGIFGFTNVTEACVNDPRALTQPGFLRDCPGYLFYDTIHPTGAAHAQIAGAVTDLIAPIPLPAGLWLVLTAVGVLGAARHVSRRV